MKNDGSGCWPIVISGIFTFIIMIMVGLSVFARRTSPGVAVAYYLTTLLLPLVVMAMVAYLLNKAEDKPGSTRQSDEEWNRVVKESKIVGEWKQFQEDRMEPYYEAHRRGEISDDQVYQALLACPSFRTWLKENHPDALNWMKYIPK